jgi:flavin-dependent dehydrogenase
MAISAAGLAHRAGAFSHRGGCHGPGDGLPSLPMQQDVDVVVIGGAFSGASVALLLRRENPALSVLVIERAEHFDRKVGEATTEVSGFFLTKRLALSHHLCHHHVAKNGLRFWFAQSADDAFDRCGEVGGYYQVRLPSYQVDREVLDEHVLGLAAAEGAAVWRPARVRSLAESGDGRTLVEVDQGGVTRTVSARWVIDASGRASVLARRKGLLHPLAEHPTNAIWARFRGVKDWDGAGLAAKYPAYASACQASRASATNHLNGYGWWCWIIPLRGGDYSAGLVYDSRLYTPPDGESLGDRLKAHLLQHPVGREIFGEAEFIAGDVKAYSNLPYRVDQIAGPGWQIVGDAAGFMDPLYSQGLDFCAWTVSWAVDRIVREADGETVCLETLNGNYRSSARMWFEGLYKDKYYYLGDKELMTAAFLLDLGMYFLGPVRTLVEGGAKGFSAFPFDGRPGRLVGRFMAFYNARLATIARRRRQAGQYGVDNLDGRTLIKGFEPSPAVWRPVWRGLKAWAGAEWKNAWLRGAGKASPEPIGAVR